MSVQFKKITSSTPLQLLKDPMVFSLVLESEEIQGDLDFEVTYSVDPHTEEYDQAICKLSVGPIPKGNIGFTIETNPVNIDQLKPEYLFGITSVIIVGKYKENPFMRIGYIMEIKYPGIENKYLVKEEELGEEIGSEENTLEASNLSEEESESEEDKIPCEKEDCEGCENCNVQEECGEECEGCDNCNVQEECGEECKGCDNCEEVEPCEKEDCEGCENCNVQEECGEECEGCDNCEEVEPCEKEDCEGCDNCEISEAECDEKKEEEEVKINENDSSKNINKESKEEFSSKKVKLSSPLLPDPLNNVSVDSLVHESSYVEIQKKLEEPLIPVIFDTGDISEENKIVINGINLDKTKIQIEFKEPPMVTMFDIPWN